MPTPTLLIVRFRVTPEARAIFQQKLVEVFEHIQSEPTFVHATFNQDIQDPGQFLVYETWYESIESFLANQLPKPYRKPFEEALIDLKVERTPQWLTPLNEWNQKSSSVGQEGSTFVAATTA